MSEQAVHWFAISPVYDEGEDWPNEWGSPDSVGASSREEALELWQELEAPHHRGLDWADVEEADHAT